MFQILIKTRQNWFWSQGDHQDFRFGWIYGCDQIKFSCGLQNIIMKIEK